MRKPISRLLILVPSFLIVSSLHSTPTKAGADCERQFVKVSSAVESRFRISHARVDGRVVSFEHLPAKRGKPTLFILNGLFAPSFQLQDFREAFEKNSKGEGLLIMYYSTQIESLHLRALQDKDSALNLKDQENNPLTLSDLASEAKAVLKESRIRGSIFPVGYSFGSGPIVDFASDPNVQRQIKELIFLSPNVHPRQDAPPGTESIEAFMRMNPFMGESGIRKLRDQSIRSTAVKAIDSLDIVKVGLPAEISRETAIRGVIAQLQSVVDFDLRTVPAMNVPVRFVVPENESTGRLVASREAFEAMKGKNTRPVSIMTVEDASHHLLRDETEIGVNVLLSIMRPESRTRDVPAAD